MSGRGGGGRGSGRGGGRRGRGQDRGRGQPSQSSSRGGGGRARGRGSSGSTATYNPPPPQMAPAQPPPQMAVAPPVPPSGAAFSHPSSSSGVGSLSREVSEKLTMEPVAVTTAPPLPPSLSKAIRFPPRPGFGTVGTKCVVRANHFLVDVANADLHHYDVTIKPEVTSKKLNRAIMKQLIDVYEESHLGRRCPAYDGRKSLYTAGPLPFESKELVIKLTEEDWRERQFKVAIKLASKPDLHYLREFLSGRHFEFPQEAIQVLDVVLRAKPSQIYTEVGRSFFHTSLGPRGELGNGIEYWCGYYQCLRPTQMGLSLIIDASARSFYEPILVSEIVVKHFRLSNLSKPLSDQDRIKVKKALMGVRVRLICMNYAKTCKIIGVSRDPISQLTFTLDDKRTNVSVVKYFRDKYNVVLKYPSLPALQRGSEARPVYLPMELCSIVEGQRYTKKLNEQQVRSLLRATCQRPNIREGNITKMLPVNKFGMDVCKELAMIEARVLNPPALKYHDSGRDKIVNPSCGQWNMINKKMVNGGKVDFWTCVNFSSEYWNMSEDFCAELVKMCNSKGMVFCQTPSIAMRSARADRIDQTLMDVYKESAGLKKPLQLLIIILPDLTGSYGKIKRICETELGIVSQCCKPVQAAKFSNQYFENVALKINAKVGGRNTVLNDAILRRIPLVTDVPTIIFGACVSHPRPGEDSSSSIAAVVASMDWPELTKYRGVVSAQTDRVEIIQDLYKQTKDPQKGLVEGGMFKFSAGNCLLLSSSRQDKSLLELSSIEMVLVKDNSAKFCFMKWMRFGRLVPRYRKDICLGLHLLWFKRGIILAYSLPIATKLIGVAIYYQGTSKSTHYHVLFDENGFTADILQVLTNSLCYTYARCTKSVSIVPPAYYAHLAAYRARYYIEDEMSDGGSTGVGVRPLPSIKDNVKEVMFYV
ncbi:hypothetical protein ES288_D09G112300v1 [Gossypium darwinii]|uniref:Piwi domain-containing protein n=1 Tax=Gossypium darwinii TaxID=34276 RepID=A0A5D2BCN2_GOSDA|nr:hypothetical protein ES288_D09G112300v1 [Gossypium darwinii]